MVDRRADAAPPLPPLLVVHAAGDTNTTEAMSRRFVARRRAAGGTAGLEVVAGVGHSFGNIPSHRSSELVQTVSAFLTDAGLGP